MQAWARDGLTDEQIAANIRISTSTLYEWKKKYSEISESLKRGKEIVDVLVENALLQKALGISKTIKKPIKVKEILYEDGKRISEEEHIEYVDEEIYIPPDTTAQIYWTKNRMRGKWMDKPVEDTSQRLDEIKSNIDKLSQILEKPMPERKIEDYE